MHKKDMFQIQSEIQSEIHSINEFELLTLMVQNFTCNFSVCNNFMEVIFYIFTRHC